jgi:hypothetical protein
MRIVLSNRRGEAVECETADNCGQRGLAGRVSVSWQKVGYAPLPLGSVLKYIRGPSILGV